MGNGPLLNSEEALKGTIVNQNAEDIIIGVKNGEREEFSYIRTRSL